MPSDAGNASILDELDRMGQADNTLIVFIEGDNGGSPEGDVTGSTNELGTLANGMREDTAWLLSTFGSARCRRRSMRPMCEPQKPAISPNELRPYRRSQSITPMKTVRLIKGLTQSRM